MPISQFYYPSEIELVTGFGKEQLRKWRQRFGFPPKESNFSGETAYSLTTVNQLLLIKRLLEAGFRPAQVVALNFWGVICPMVLFIQAKS